MTRTMTGRFDENEIRTIMAIAASEGIELSRPDFRMDGDKVVAEVEHLPAQRFLQDLGFETNN